MGHSIILLMYQESDHYFLHVEVKGIDGLITHFTCDNVSLINIWIWIWRRLFKDYVIIQFPFSHSRYSHKNPEFCFIVKSQILFWFFIMAIGNIMLVHVMNYSILTHILTALFFVAMKWLSLTTSTVIYKRTIKVVTF